MADIEYGLEPTPSTIDGAKASRWKKLGLCTGDVIERTTLVLLLTLVAYHTSCMVFCLPTSFVAYLFLLATLTVQVIKMYWAKAERSRLVLMLLDIAWFATLSGYIYFL